MQLLPIHLTSVLIGLLTQRIKCSCDRAKQFRHVSTLNGSELYSATSFFQQSSCIEDSEITGFQECFKGCNAVIACHAFGNVAKRCVMCYNDTTSGTSLQEFQYRHFYITLDQIASNAEPCELYGLIGGKNDPTFDVSIIGFIRLNGQQFNLKDIDQDGPDYKARGINVIRVDAQSCEIQESRSFDTYEYESDADEFVTYINDLPQNSIFLVLGGDDFSNKIAANGRIEPENLLRTLGSTCVGSHEFRSSLALLVKVMSDGQFCHLANIYQASGLGPSIVHVHDLLLLQNGC